MGWRARDRQFIIIINLLYIYNIVRPFGWKHVPIRISTYVREKYIHIMCPRREKRLLGIKNSSRILYINQLLTLFFLHNSTTIIHAPGLHFIEQEWG